MKLINKTFLLLLVIAVSFASCDSYLDVNEDPNNPVADIVTPDLMLPASQNGCASIMQGVYSSSQMVNFGNVMMNQWAGDVTNFTSGNSDEYVFNMTNTFYDTIWDRIYIATDKLQAIINKDSDEYRNFTAIARILKAHNMQYIVDLYGDAPYSEAFQRGANYQPAYDKDSDIYMALYDELTQAISDIDNATSVAVSPGSSDVMLGGNMVIWKKFANTLRLKLLVRASSSTDAAVQTWVTTKFPDLNGVAFLGAGETISNNPGYFVNAGNQSPFWDTFNNTDGTPTQLKKFTVGSGYFIDFLKGLETPSAPYDNRISKYFTNPPYQGIVQGADDPADPTQDLSFVGPGLLRGADQDAWFFTSSESFFLQAQAVLNGYLPGNAQNLFETGVTESFNLLGLSADAASYVASIAGIPGVGWSNNPTDDLKAIMLQKWVALHSIDPTDTFIDHNRTGYPNPPLPLLATDTHRPYRLIYPLSEYTGNSANVPNITRSDVFVPSIFWQQ